MFRITQAYYDSLHPDYKTSTHVLVNQDSGGTALVPFEIVGEVLTVEDWRKAGSFQKACEGRTYPIEIEESIYEDFA